MRRFSMETSLGDAFGLARRRPLSVLVWGVVLVAPLLLTLAIMLPALDSMIRWDALETADAPPTDFFAQIMQLQAAFMLANVVQLLTLVVVYTAVLRAVLRPEERSWFSLRIGMDELRVGVVGLAIGVGLYAVMMFAMMIGFAAGFASWGGGGEPGPFVAVMILAAFGLGVLLLWGMARVSLMAPASVMFRDFGFARGWRLAHRQGWALLGMMIVIYLILTLVEMVLALGVMAVAFATIGTMGMEWAATAGENPTLMVQAWLEANWPWIVLGGLVAAAFYGLVVTLSVAPFASACRQLAEGVDPQASPASAN